MIFSAFGCFLGLACLGIYDLLKYKEFAIIGPIDVSEYNWIPLVSFSFVIFVANLGNIRLYSLN